MLDFALSPADFRARYFERAPFLSKAIARRFVWQMRDVDRLLELIEPQERSVQLFNQGLVPQHAYTRDAVELGQSRRRLDKSAFYAQLRGGATLVINRIETHSLECRRLCADVSRFAGLQTTSNAYLSFGGRGTFGKHWDTHDVFAIQLIGRKRWQVFEPTFPLPLSFHTSERAAADRVNRPVLDCVLEAGDVLYVPRGWWHQTLPLAEGSFHLSVGTYTATLYDYFLWVCARRLSMVRPAREAFDASADHGEALAELTRVLDVAMRDPAMLAAFHGELVQRERLNAEFQLGLLLDPTSKGLRGNEILSMTSFNPQQVERPEVLVNGVRLELDPVSHAVVGVLRDGALSFDVLCVRLVNVSRDRLQRAVLDLAQHDAVTIASS